MEKDNRVSFVCYPSFLDAIELMPTEEQKGKAALALMRLGINGEWNADEPMVQMVLTMALPTIGAAKDRYTKAIANGKKGGRPQVDRTQIVELKNTGMTNEEVASEMACSPKTVSRALTESGWTKLDKRQNLNNNKDNDKDNNNNNHTTIDNNINNERDTDTDNERDTHTNTDKERDSNREKDTLSSQQMISFVELEKPKPIHKSVWDRV